MELIAKISKGTIMDQVYLPKNRQSLPTGSYVIIKQIDSALVEQEKITLNFYGVRTLEPIKLEIIRMIIKIIKQNVLGYQNIIITGSFLDKGFKFKDIDILIISEEMTSIGVLDKILETQIGIKPHILIISNKELQKGINSDPLYELMLSNCVSEKKFIYKKRQIINWKILDLHLLKSKPLVSNFDILTGTEKYNLTRNLVAIKLFIKNIELNKKILHESIIKEFNLENIDELKENVLDKKHFLKKYKELYERVFNDIMEGINNDSK